MVINVGALKSGDLRLVERDIEAVTAPCRECGALSKVIIEAALLTDDEKVTACTLAKAAGADYVKTSTGFGPGGATAADVALMRRVVGDEMGVKAAGGVRDLEGLQGDGRRRRHARRRQRRRAHRAGVARAAADGCGERAIRTPVVRSVLAGAGRRRAGRLASAGRSAYWRFCWRAWRLHVAAQEPAAPSSWRHTSRTCGVAAGRGLGVDLGAHVYVAVARLGAPRHRRRAACVCPATTDEDARDRRNAVDRRAVSDERSRRSSHSISERRRLELR